MRKIALTEEEAYQVLGVDPSASDREIKQRFKELSLKLHPDRNPNGTKDYQWVALAYNILTGRSKPGRPELGSWKSRNTPPPPKEVDPEEVKKAVLEAARFFNAKPIRKGTSKFGIELSPLVGIGIFIEDSKSVRIGSINVNGIHRS